MMRDWLDAGRLYWPELAPVILLAAIAWLALFVKERRSLLDDVRDTANDWLPREPSRLSGPAAKGFQTPKVVPFVRPFGTTKEQWEAIERRRLGALTQTGRNGAA